MVTGFALVGVILIVPLAWFGLPPVDIHGPLHYLGVMAPTCGLTRGLMWAARGELSTAWMYNPLSVLVLPALVVYTLRSVYGRLTGRWWNVSLRWRSWLGLVVTLIVIALAIRQQYMADLLISDPAGVTVGPGM